MAVIQVWGLQRLQGEITIQGSKNAVLPVMAAALLHKGTTVIKNVPLIQDVRCMAKILASLGCRLEFSGHTLAICADRLSSCQIPEEEGRKMRSSVMLLGPLLGRGREAVFGQPGGCSIGERPIDLHLSALGQMGASVCRDGNQIHLFAKRLRGCEIYLGFPSVGATENIIMAAVAAEGTTRLCNAAIEPEIRSLCDCLTGMGARIEHANSRELVIHGSMALHDSEYSIPGDRIVAGTYLGAALTAGGDVAVRGVPAWQMDSFARAARRMGAAVSQEGDGLRLIREGVLLPIELATAPYPGFPTDLQSVMLSAAATANGVSRIRENVFEERFATAKELHKFGVPIIIEGRSAIVQGGCSMSGCKVKAHDLRGGAALVAAALAAKGESRIGGYSFICRGYEDICRDLSSVGAKIGLIEEACREKA